MFSESSSAISISFPTKAAISSRQIVLMVWMTCWLPKARISADVSASVERSLGEKEAILKSSVDDMAALLELLELSDLGLWFCVGRRGQASLDGGGAGIHWVVSFGTAELLGMFLDSLSFPNKSERESFERSFDFVLVWAASCAGHFE